MTSSRLGQLIALAMIVAAALMAQDFHAAFGVGELDTHIGTVDADGVALAAIQGLHQLVKDKDKKIASLEDRIAALETLVEKITAQR